MTCPALNTVCPIITPFLSRNYPKIEIFSAQDTSDAKKNINSSKTDDGIWKYIPVRENIGIRKIHDPSLFFYMSYN